MKITVFAAGSRGDIQPCLALCKGLQRAGYEVLLAAPENFADFSQQHGVNFFPLRGDVQKIMASKTGKKFMQKGGANPLHSIRAIRAMLGPVVREMTEDAYAACQQADALVCLGVQSAFGKSIAEALRIPLVNVEPTPLLPTRAFAAPSWPIQRDLGGWHNYLSGVAMLQVVWLWYRPFVNEFRQGLGLKAYSAASFQRILQTTPMLGAYSPSLIPKAADWPATMHVSGYLFLDEQSGWQPPADLPAFLEAGDPPVYIGFGSMAGENPQKLARLITQALDRSGQRGLLLTGWGGLQADFSNPKLFVLEAAPHNWLFPRMAAVVHHGGAGTTAEGLRAGAPTVIVPFAFDQFFWGAQVHRRGLGPPPIPQKQLSVERLAQAIHSAASDGVMRQRVRACAQAIKAEDGVSNAVQILQRLLGAPQTSESKPPA